MKKPLLIGIIVGSAILLIAIALIVYLVINKLKTQNAVTFKSKLYTGYLDSNIASSKNPIFFDINYSLNNVSSITAGYSVTTNIPDGKDSVLNNSFTVTFSNDIVNNVVYVINFVKSSLSYNISMSKNGSILSKNKNQLDTTTPSASVSIILNPFSISDISLVYTSFLTTQTMISVNSTDNQTVYVGYVGNSQTDYLNILFFDIDFTNNTCFTLDPTNYNPITGSVTGNVNDSKFSLSFTNSFLGTNTSMQFITVDNTTYQVLATSSGGNINFVVQTAQISDMAKTFSTLLSQTRSTALKSLMNTSASISFPNKSHKKKNLEFMNKARQYQLLQKDIEQKEGLMRHFKDEFIKKFQEKIKEN
jgi:hypothetical protein